VRNPGSRQRRVRKNQRNYGSAIAFTLWVLSPLLATGCRGPAEPDPPLLFQQIHQDFLQGNLDSAQEKADQARQAFSVANPTWSMKFLILEAEILTYQGRRPDVLKLLNQADVSYPVAGDLAIKRNLLCALANARLGQAQMADSEMQEARRLSEESNSQLNGEVLRTDAQIQVYRDHLTEAVDLFRRSLKFARARQDAFLEATDLLNLGLVSLKLAHYDESLQLLNEAASFAAQLQARSVTQAALGNMGVAYSALGDYEKALSSFEQAQAEASRIGTTSAQVDWLWSAGAAYANLGNLEEAAICYKRSLAKAQAIHSVEEISGIQTDLAFLLYRQRQFAEAKLRSDQAIEAARSAGDEQAELEPLVLQALLVTQRPNPQDAEPMFLQIYARSAQNPRLREQIENALANFYAARKQSKKAQIWYRKSIQTFEQQRASVNAVELRLPFFANGDALYRDYADFLIASQKHQEALLLLDAGRSSTLADALTPGQDQPNALRLRAVDPQRVARNLNANILFYSLGAEKSYLWAVTPQSTRLFDLPARSAIEAQVRSYQKSILRSSDPLRDINASAQALYRTLVEPAAQLIPQGSKVFVISDGALNELNFETLVTSGEKPHYWIEDVTLSNANSIRMLAQLNEGTSPGATAKLLLIGNPTTKGTGYETLLNAFSEIRGVEKHFPVEDRKVVTQSDAVPASYAASQPETFSYIHFVAHGTASRLSPLDSAVVLSPSPDSPDNFKLYARDIMRNPLHARLVTISACYGSGLRSYAGEGLVGLSWAFLRAGAHNVIGALWEVNDASTPLLMDRLYAELAAGSTPDNALRAAKLSLIHSQSVYRKPLYWGGFQLFTGL
jgi:CHAT domain-containing protein